MRYISVPGIEKRCSQLIMGSMIFSPENMDLTTELLDAFVAYGGNTIDTAHIYNGGKSEVALGQWLLKSNNRNDIVIIDKGAHHNEAGPRVHREGIAADLWDSLERLQVDYIDIYMLHRDDPQTPVAVIIEALNEHVAARLIGAIGTSNWTYQRIEEANEFAAAHGFVGFTCNSPNLSLAKPMIPRWPGCISADKPYCHWHEQQQMPLLSWSSQAVGFFTGRYSPDNIDNEEIVRLYYNADNWERLRRAKQLAAEKSVGSNNSIGGNSSSNIGSSSGSIDGNNNRFNANHIALSYVLNQPFPTCALIGPQKLNELEDSMKALEISLTPREIRWLDLLED